MDNENNEAISQIENQNEIQKYMKDTCGIEVFSNELSSVELENQGYRKVSLANLSGISQLLQLAPQLVVDKVNKAATEQAFKVAIENSYKCILDPSMHLATFKGTSEVFLGTGLDNVSNRIKGQARWLKNNAVLSISNAPQVVLSAFNALSVVTGHYFMAHINTNLSGIKASIDGIKQYFDTVKRSELKTSCEELNETIEHIRFIKNDLERTRSTIVKLDVIQRVARNSINFYREQIENIIHIASSVDDKNKVTNNIEEIKKCLVQYRYAVSVLNFSKLVKIYLNDIIDVEELSMFRDEICDTTNQYKNVFEIATTWSKKYLDDNNSLNKTSKTQILLSLGTGIAVGMLGYKSGGSFKLANQTASLVNDLFDDNRKKKKKAYVNNNDSNIRQMNDMELINSSVSAMDRHIELVNKKVEFVTVEGKCYIKYIDVNSDHHNGKC